MQKSFIETFAFCSDCTLYFGSTSLEVDTTVMHTYNACISLVPILKVGHNYDVYLCRVMIDSVEKILAVQNKKCIVCVYIGSC